MSTRSISTTAAALEAIFDRSFSSVSHSLTLSPSRKTLTWSPSILARRASTSAMSCEKRTGKEWGKEDREDRRGETKRRASQSTSCGRRSWFFCLCFEREREEEAKKLYRHHNSLFHFRTLSSQTLQPLSLFIKPAMISLRSIAGVRVVPVAAVAASSRPAIALRSAVQSARSLATPARVSSTMARRSLKSLAPRAAAGSPPAYGELIMISCLLPRARKAPQSDRKREFEARGLSTRCSDGDAIFSVFFFLSLSTSFSHSSLPPKKKS